MDERAGILNWNEAARSDASSVPPAAAWLGGLGIIPFAGLSLATPFTSDVLKAKLLFALMAYGAIILSFLGGIHWGLAIAAVPQCDDTLWRRIALSIMPSLVVHHSDFDVLIPSHSRIGKLSVGTRISILLGTPG